MLTIILTIGATISAYGNIPAIMFLIISYTAALVYLRLQLKVFGTENFKNEIRSIKNQNWTFTICILLSVIGTAFTLFDGNVGEWPAELVLGDIILIGFWRILWDSHLILVHRRVFKKTRERL